MVRCNTLLMFLLFSLFSASYADEITAYNVDQLEKQDVKSFVTFDGAFVFFLSPDDGSVFQSRIDGSALGRTLGCQVKDPNAVLYFVKQYNRTYWDLWVESDSFHGKPVGRDDRPLFRFMTSCRVSHQTKNDKRFVYVSDMRPKTHKFIDIDVVKDGFIVRNNKTKENYKVLASLITDGPSGLPVSDGLVVLPYNYLLFSCDGQIKIMDLTRKVIGDLAKGISPVVVMDTDIYFYE